MGHGDGDDDDDEDGDDEDEDEDDADDDDDDADDDDDDDESLRHLRFTLLSPMFDLRGRSNTLLPFKLQAAVQLI